MTVDLQLYVAAFTNVTEAWHSLHVAGGRNARQLALANHG